MADINENAREVYADIIDLPRHQSRTRVPMSLYDRAAQFAPFAALVGFNEMVDEEARLTDEEISISDSRIETLNLRLRLIADEIEEKHHPEISVVYFAPDSRKEGGSYEKYTGTVKAVDPIGGRIIFFAGNGRTNGMTIPLSNLREIHTRSMAAEDFVL